MSATLQFDFRFGDPGRRRDGSTRRLLLMGDFGARLHRGVTDAASLPRRPVISVDVDSLDAAIARFAPRVAATLGDGIGVDLCPACIADLHPDRLIDRYAPLAPLLSLRRRLLDPKQFDAAAAELGAANRPEAATSPAEDDRTSLRRLLGDSRATASPSARSAARAVDALVRRIAPSSSGSTLEFQAQYLAAVDASATARLRALLHLPAFQSLEAVWRGAEFLVSRLDLGEELELHLFDVTLDELRADAAQAAGDTGRSALARRLLLLAEEAADADASWLLAGGLFSFEAADLDLLGAIGAAARAAGMPFIAGAGASIAGTVPDISTWQPPDTEALARWQVLRRSESAAAIGLVAPRFLLRLPYGPATDAIDSFPFEELTGSPPSPNELLWGDGALAAMLVQAGDDAGSLDIADLPALTFDDDGERKLLPCAERLIGERVGDKLSDHGLMPLLGSNHRNAVRLAGVRSIAAR